MGQYLDYNGLKHFKEKADQTYLTKTKYEYSKDYNGLSKDNFLCLGKFTCYDSNITIDITSTGQKSYTSQIVIATRNVNPNTGNVSPKIFGDETGWFFNHLKIIRDPATALVEVYLETGPYIKTAAHIKGINLYAEPTNILEKVDSVPEQNAIEIIRSTIKPIGFWADQPVTGNPITTSTPTFGLTHVTGIRVLDNTCGLLFRHRMESGYKTGFYYSNYGNEGLTLSTQNVNTTLQFINGVDPTTMKSESWKNLTPALQIKNNMVAINQNILNEHKPNVQFNVRGQIFANEFGRGGDSSPAIIMEKHGTGTMGIGSHKEENTMWFGITSAAAENTQFSWNDNVDLICKIKGSIVATNGYHHGVHDSDDYILLAGGGTALMGSVSTKWFEPEDYNANGTSPSGIYSLKKSIEGTGSESHSMFINVTHVGTPFQLQFPDLSYYIYKSKDGGKTWGKISAGYADSANTANEAIKAQKWKCNSDELNISDYNRDDGKLFFNYRDSTKEVKTIYMCNGINGGEKGTSLVEAKGFKVPNGTSKDFLLGNGGTINASLLPGIQTKYYGKFSSLPTDGNSFWASLFKISDSAGHGTALCAITAYAHTSMIFTVCKGYDASATVNILNYVKSRNAQFATCDAVRVIKGGIVQVHFNCPTSNTATYVNIQCRIFSSDTVDTFFEELTPDLSTSNNDVLQSINAYNNAISAKYFVKDGEENSDKKVLLANGEAKLLSALGGGDVSGPGQSVDNAIARFDGTTGKLIQSTSHTTVSDSGAIMMDSSASGANNDTPTALEYGSLHSYGTFKIAADTDKTGTEFLYLTSGFDVANCNGTNGLAIGKDSIKWKDSSIMTENYLGFTASEKKYPVEKSTDGKLYVHVPWSGGSSKWYNEQNYAGSDSEEGVHVCYSTIEGSPSGNHSMFINVKNIGTPFQLQFPDSSDDYIYKWTTADKWRKLKAGYADSAGTAETAGYANTAGDSDTLDTLDSTQFARRDVSGYLNMGDATLAYYQMDGGTGCGDENFCLQTSFDGTNGKDHHYVTDYGYRCNLVLQPRGGNVMIGNNWAGSGSNSKLSVNGDVFASGFKAKDLDDNYILLAGGGHKAIKDFCEGTTYEYSRELACGGSDGNVRIGSFPCYDSNITIDISTTANDPMHGTLVIATQNVRSDQTGSIHPSLFGDDTGELLNRLYVTRQSGSDLVEVYIAPPGWSKTTVHIQGVALARAPEHLLEKNATIPDSGRIGISTGVLRLIHGTSSSPNHDNGPRIEFEDSFNNYQRVCLSYSNYDDYRPESGLIVSGPAGGTWFEVKGNSYVSEDSHAKNFYASSDKRLKTDITNSSINNYYSILNKINLYEFNWKDKNKYQGRNFGTIAQELEQVVPEHLKRFFVNEENSKNHYLSINDGKLVYLTIGALQEQLKINEELKTKNNKLEERLAKLEKILGVA